MGSYLYMDMLLTQEFICFWKASANIIFLNWTLFYMCQGHSPFKEGLWEILCNEFELGFLYVGFPYEGRSMPLGSLPGALLYWRPGVSGLGASTVSWGGYPNGQREGLQLNRICLLSAALGAYLTSLSLSFFICKVWIIAPPSEHCCEVFVHI